MRIHMLALVAMTAYAGSINFEHNGPCNFLETTALSNAYAAQGVTFIGLLAV